MIQSTRVLFVCIPRLTMDTCLCDWNCVAAKQVSDNFFRMKKKSALKASDSTYEGNAWLHSKFSALGPVSRKSRNFSGVFRVTWFSLYLQNEGVSKHETFSYFCFYFLYNIWKDQLYRISRSYFYEWRFVPENFSRLSRNWPLETNNVRCGRHSLKSPI